MIHWLRSWQGISDIMWLVFLLLVLGYFWRKWLFLNQVKYWLITKGRITQFFWTRDGRHIWPKIEYTYQVCDMDFIGEYFFLDTANNNPHSHYSRYLAYRTAIAFEKDQDIDVYYNPNNPAQAVLDIRIPRKLKFIIVLLITMIGVHLLMIIRSW